MRPATQIRNLAIASIEALEPALVTPETSRATVVNNLLQIRILAEDMDARTGTIDPSKKSWWRRILPIVILSVLTAASSIYATGTEPRYWVVPLDSVAVGHVKHTHIETRGEVAYTRTEDDGDLHIKLRSPWDSTRWFIAECIPRLPCTRPRTGADIIIRGIFRRDPEHSWYEIHPVDSWYYATIGE